jgi:hypothetical protein
MGGGAAVVFALITALYSLHERELLRRAMSRALPQKLPTQRGLRHRSRPIPALVRHPALAVMRGRADRLLPTVSSLLFTPVDISILRRQIVVGAR